jgi:hypothetical protein
MTDVSDVSGLVENTILTGTISIYGTDNSYFLDCKSGCVGLGAADLPKLDMTGSNKHVAFRNYAGPIKVINSTNALNTLCIDVGGGSTVIIDSSCTAGTIYIRGVCDVVNSGTMVVHTEAQLDVTSIIDGVWDTAASLHNISGSLGNRLNAAGNAGDPWSADLSAYTEGTAGKMLSDVKTQTTNIGSQVRTALTAEMTHILTLENNPGLTTTQATMLLEMYELLGLDPTKPLVVTKTARTAGTIRKQLQVMIHKLPLPEYNHGAILLQL